MLGVDDNPAAIAHARERAAAASLPNASFACEDASQLEQRLKQTREQEEGLEQGRAHISGGAGARISQRELGISQRELGISQRELGEVDVVVALHACGGLSDVALGVSAACGASALVCTCCFNKHRRLCPAAAWGIREPQKDLLCRMADSDQPLVQAEARRTVSCLRLDALQRRHEQEEARGGGGASGGGGARGAVGVAAGGAGSGGGAGGAVRCSIKRFPESYSKQNTVLVAEAW